MADAKEAYKEHLLRVLAIYLRTVESQRELVTEDKSMTMYLDGQRDACNFITEHIKNS